MTKYLPIFVILLSISVCACQSDQSILSSSDTTLSDALGEFCTKLPRPEYADLDLHEVSNDWFEVYLVGDGVWAIYEPHQWQEVISYLILGDQQAVLFDSGNGLGDIRAVVNQLTPLPVLVINSHSHIDHIGGNHQFENIASLSTEFSLSRSKGVNDESVKEEASPAALCRPLPTGVRQADHRIRPYQITRVLMAGQHLELGGRKLEVISIPGHTDDSIALLDKEAGYLWTGDSYYAGPIWLFADETDLSDYQQSINYLADLSPQLTSLFPAHNAPRVDPKILIDVASSFNKVLTGSETSKPEWEGVLRFQYDGFSFLLREDFADNN